MRVLVIEDDAALNGILAKRLAEEGHSMDCCFDGRDGLDYAEAARGGDTGGRRRVACRVQSAPAVDAVRSHPARQPVRRARLRMPHDDDVGIHGVESERRVFERLALLHARRAHGDVDHFRAQILRRRFERSARAGGVFVKQRDDRPVFQFRKGFFTRGDYIVIFVRTV